MDINQDAINRWDEHAQNMGKDYTRDGDLNRKYLLNPVFFEMLGELKDKKVLDAGCGEGYLCRLMSEKGAEVTGFDFSGKMIEVARRKSADFGIRLEQADFQNLAAFSDESFDIVVSNMVLHDLPDLSKAVQETHRVLKRGGHFVFSILHPCFDTPDSGWERDQEGRKNYWRVRRYFDESVNEQRSNSSNKLLWFHRTLSTYIKTLRDTGFIIDDIAEPEPSEEAIAAHADFVHFKDMCHFLVLKVIKV